MANKFLNNLATPIHDWKEENEQESKSIEMRKNYYARGRRES